jgi:hypothetical protein
MEAGSLQLLGLCVLLLLLALFRLLYVIPERFKETTFFKLWRRKGHAGRVSKKRVMVVIGSGSQF